MRPLGSLRRFSVENAPDQRIRTSGTVTLREHGRGFYLQDGSDALFVASRRSDPLVAGDTVEVVGFPGDDGARFVLREGTYRRTGGGPEPAPRWLGAEGTSDDDLDSLLVRAEGKVLGVMRHAERTTILLEGARKVFEARIEGAAEFPDARVLQPGTLLVVTGVYAREGDGTEAEGFRVRLRTVDDVVVRQPAAWWTPARLWRVVAVGTAVFLVALAYGIQATRKNRQLREARADLERLNAELEQRVSGRTAELREEIAAKERAHAELKQTQRQLIEASRQAGMADVATAILHDVGNVLNSVNVSTALVADRLRHSRMTRLSEVASLFEQHAGDLGTFLEDDEKGRLLPAYLKQLAEALERERETLMTEVDSLGANLEHIKAVVVLQQDRARVSGIVESVEADELMDSALRVCVESYARHSIRLIRDYRSVARLSVDRHRVLQILINLLTNAKQALERNRRDDRCVVAGIEIVDGGRVRFTVRDNGIGIAPENLSRLFTQGFSNKKDGHGIGLHSGANAARELRGKLDVHSDGPGRGATFTLELPVASEVAAAPPQTPRVASDTVA
ncbi:MAG: hypothetical protein JNL97_05730 [Verrucomicrobiales bacterium]|nr:hypothetical protein [Verrucomicrobiales bacterium]